MPKEIRDAKAFCAAANITIRVKRGSGLSAFWFVTVSGTMAEIRSVNNFAQWSTPADLESMLTRACEQHEADLKQMPADARPGPMSINA
jgi:hypothetical protein